ncbi:MAG: hypothetical protein ACRDBO_14590, partial [Lachnospiraceae bacterium]
MKLTEHYELKMPEGNEYVSVDDLNHNASEIDRVLAEKVDATGGDVAETVVSSIDTITTEFPVPAAGDKTKTVVGKVKKFIEDFNNFKTGILTVGMIVNNAVTNRTDLPVTAAVAYALQNQLTQLNSDYVSRTKDNTVGSQLQLTKNNGIGGGSYAGGPV